MQRHWPGFYELYFEMPWSRVYTLNIDDLEQAASQEVQLETPRDEYLCYPRIRRSGDEFTSTIVPRGCPSKRKLSASVRKS